jgi:hypothetical protein
LRKADPKSLSDDGLSRICAETRIEKWLLHGGCLSSAAALFLPVTMLLIFRDLAGPLFLGPALTAAALFWAHHLAGSHKRRYREELAYRRGLGPWPQYVTEAEAILRQKEADWVFLFTLRGLPHGSFWWLRLALKEGPPSSARAHLRILPRWERPFFKRVETDVPESLVLDLVRFLKELDLTALTDVPPTVIDGSPCRFTAVRREPWCVTSAGCNLGGLIAKPLPHPTAALCKKLWDITWQLTPRSL